MQSQLQPKLHYVGVLDWSIRSVDGHRTPQGITYNSYLISDKRSTIIDTVPVKFIDEYLHKI